MTMTLAMVFVRWWHAASSSDYFIPQAIKIHYLKWTHFWVIEVTETTPSTKSTEKKRRNKSIHLLKAFHRKSLKSNLMCISMDRHNFHWKTFFVFMFALNSFSLFHIFQDVIWRWLTSPTTTLHRRSGRESKNSSTLLINLHSIAIRLLFL